MQALVESATGRLVSLSTIFEGEPDEGFEVLDVDAPAEGELWDEGTRTFVARPAPILIDRVEDVIALPLIQSFWGDLAEWQQGGVRELVSVLFGTRRYRAPDEPLAVEGF